MDKADVAFAVQNSIQRHATQLEQVDLLLVGSRNLFGLIWQSRKRYVVFSPKIRKIFWRIRPDGEYFRIALGELWIPIPQARQLRAAEWSHETAQESQHNYFFPTITGKTDHTSKGIFQLKIGRFLTVEKHFNFPKLLKMQSLHPQFALAGRQR